MTRFLATCSFCLRKADEVPHLVIADRGTVICLACARRCVDMCEAADAAPVGRFSRTEVAAPPRAAPDTRHLDAFLHYARAGGLGGTPEPLLPWLREFLDSYETAVLDTVRATAADGDSLVRANKIGRAFDVMMLPYRGDSRRPYLGTVFDRIVGRSIREGFSYHVDMTMLTPVEGEAA